MVLFFDLFWGGGLVVCFVVEFFFVFIEDFWKGGVGKIFEEILVSWILGVVILLCVFLVFFEFFF